jgi:hypothetical protein
MGLTVEQLLAKEEIRDVIYRRARAADRKNVELARSCYHPDATEDHGGFRGLAEDFLAESPISWGPDAPIKLMWHTVSNVLIEFQAKEAAKVETYNFTAITAKLAEVDYQMLVGGRYLDDFKRIDGVWGISARTLVFDWSKVDLASVPYWIVMKKDIAKLPFGSPDGADPLYLFLRKSIHNC